MGKKPEKGVKVLTEVCEIPLINEPDESITEILQNAKTIAIVGLSDKPERPSYQVAQYLQLQGYRIIPVNPNISEVLGEKAYPSLLEVPLSVDVVDIFRKPSAVPEIVEQALQIKAAVIWMQEGIVNNSAAEKARSAGIKVVMNKCMMKEHLARFNSRKNQKGENLS